MIKIYDVGKLKIFSDRVGRIHGTEDWCLFLYALVKMHRPAVVLELGTGAAVTALWLAQAVKENEAGHVWTVDDGRGWAQILADNEPLFLPAERQPRFRDYLDHVAGSFELQDHLTLLEHAMPPFPEVGAAVDLLFSDFQHGPNEILGILAFYLPRMADAGSIFIDSASTSFPSYGLLELLVPLLNAGKIPRMLLERIDADRRAAAVEWVRQHSFQLVHLTESKGRAQNSTAWIKFWPADLRAYPRASFH